MLTHHQQKLIAALQVKKYRQKYRKFVVEGDKMVAELLRQTRLPVSALFGLERWAGDHAALLAPFLEIFNPVSAGELKKISGLSTPNGVLALAELPATLPDLDLLQTGRCFYLDGLQDPGNLGTILRIADWFGLPAVFCSPDCVDAFSPKVVQASMGAIFRIHTREIALSDLVAQRPGLPVMGAVLGGDDVFRTVLPDHGLLVVGNEGRGLGAIAEQLLTHRLTIPRHPRGQAESLNAAVAAGILAAAWCAPDSR